MVFKSFENIFFIILISLLFINLFNKEGYKDCKSELYNKNLEEIKKNKGEVLLGYNSNDYIYKTLMLTSKEPLPVNANFFLGKY
tara:strand:+ start:271 stop:522 length:252 start_codon:yes stop_codon:yes gene_type:complete